jgi:Uncharacterised nucleotidyltransferase
VSTRRQTDADPEAQSGDPVSARPFGQLALDIAAAEAADALERAGITSILLKGPAIASRLYDVRSERSYSDVDLMVAPERFADAKVELVGLGYRDVLVGFADVERTSYANAFQRGGSVPVHIDLHRSLWWCESPSRVWSALSSRTHRLEVAGRDLRVLDDPALVLIIAGHALQHHLARATNADLSRAITRIDRDVWLEANALAVDLGADGLIPSALGLVTEGVELLARLEVPDAVASASIQLRVMGSPPVAATLQRVAESPSWQAGASLLVHKLAPTPAFIRRWSRIERETYGSPVPLDGQGRLGLAVAYVVRIWRGLRATPNAIRAWRGTSTARCPEATGSTRDGRRDP